MNSIWKQITPPLRKEDVVKLAVGPQKSESDDFTLWQMNLSEIIIGDAFGVDRMDYLLRDAYHLGVPYGKFDHYRLIDTMRILPSPQQGKQNPQNDFALGVQEGGLQTAEALILARYFMYSQVYFHPVRRIYDIHLRDFLEAWLENRLFPTELPKFLSLADNQINASLLEAASDRSSKLYENACQITKRNHFRKIYARNPQDIAKNPEAGEEVFESLKKEFGKENFRHDRYTQKSGAPDFPVQLQNLDRYRKL